MARFESLTLYIAALKVKDRGRALAPDLLLQKGEQQDYGSFAGQEPLPGTLGHLNISNYRRFGDEVFSKAFP